MPESRDELIGTLIQDKYKVLRKQGEGGMGAVYEGEHTLIGRRVAIKLLHPELSERPTLVKRFQREARAATAIGNKHIVEVTDMGELPDGTVFMVLEYLDGRDLLRDMHETGPMSLERAVPIMAQVCGALHAAHAKGIVHRDLKPENIFLIEDDENPDFVKVLDFGVAKFMSNDAEESSITRTGFAIGTSAYMSPEQAQGLKKVDHRSDIFALGVILYLLLTGRLPFQGGTPLKVMMSICNDTPPPLAKHRGDLPEGIQTVVDIMLEKAPENRYPDCNAVKEALRPFGDVGRESTMGPSIPVDATAPLGEEAVIPGTAPTAADNGNDQAAGFAPTDVEGRGGRRAGRDSKQPQKLSPDDIPTRVETEGSVPLEPSVSTLVPGDREGASKRPLLLGLMVITIAAIAATVYIGLQSSETPNNGAGEPATTTEPTKNEETETSTVWIIIEATPSQAELFLDGEPIANPFDAHLPTQQKARSLEAKLAGFKSVKRQLSLRYDQRVRLKLEPIEPPAGSVGSADAAPEFSVETTEEGPTKRRGEKRRPGDQATKAPVEDPASEAPVKTKVPTEPAAPVVTPPPSKAGGEGDFQPGKLKRFEI